MRSTFCLAARKTFSRRSLATAGLAVLTGIVLASCGDEGNLPGAGGSAQYTYGTKISFAKAGRGSAHQVSGWSTPEPQFTWTEGDTAALAVRVPPTETAVALRVRASGFMNPPDLTSQPVEVLVNDQKIADWQVGALAEHTAMVPPALVKEGGVLTFTFKIPKAIAPKAAGVAEDPRILGMCVHEVELRTVG
jgi:hypothetical protein